MPDLVLQWDTGAQRLFRASGGSRSAWTKLLTKATMYGGRDALRTLASGANKGVRARKALKLAVVARGMKPFSPSKGAALSDMIWTLRTSGADMPLAAYPYRDTRKTGVWVTVNKGARRKIRNAFVARMSSGHVGVFRRVPGVSRFPIKEGFSTRLSETVQDLAPELLAKARDTFGTTWSRVVRAELAKLAK